MHMKTSIHNIALRFFLILFVLPAAAMHEVPLTLQEEWDLEVETPHPPSTKIMANEHVIFVPGIFNEISSITNGSFNNNIKVVEREFGATTTIIGLSTKDSVPENADTLHEKILELYNRDKKIITLVGHSKGGATIVNLLLRYPELIFDNIVSQALVMQGCLSGSPLVERINTCTAKIAIGLLKPNLECLTTAGATEIMTESFAQFSAKLDAMAAVSDTPIESLRQQISSRIFYVSSYVDGEVSSLGIRIILDVLNDDLDRDGILHDGLVPLLSQTHPAIGIPLGDVICDHSGMTVKKPISNISDTRQRALTRLCFMKMLKAR